eukprot:g1703.t1
MVVGVSLTTHASSVIAAFAVLAILDVTACRMATSSIGARWFLLHALANAVITVMCLGDIQITLGDPVMAFLPTVQESSWPTYFVMGLHLAHCCLPWYAATLNDQDFFHHFAFAFSLAGLNLYFHWGPVCNFLNFFVCGVPGMVDYALLAMVKEGKVGRLDEKRVNSWINNWIRGPGCVVSAGFIYAGWAHGSMTHIPTPVVFVAIALIAANGQYYSGRVIANHAKCEAEDKLQKKDWDHPHPSIRLFESIRIS